MKFAEKLPQWVALGLAFPLIFLNGWLLLVVFNYFHTILNVVLAASLLAFVLDYPVNLLEKYGVKHTPAVVLIFLVTLFGLVGAGITLVPIALTQLRELANRLPTWIQSGATQLEALQNLAIARNWPIDLTGLTTELTQRLSSQAQAIAGQALGFAVGTVGGLLDVILTVVLTFYLLWRGRNLWEGLLRWLPPRLAKELRFSLGENFHNYFVGQVTVASLMGLSMTLGFLLLRVPFGLLFGLVVGVFSLVPFGGSLSIALVTVLVAFNDFWLGVKVLLVALAIQQGIENGIAPRLLGGFTGLNPVWVLISLLLGAKLGGVLGLLIAVPLASFIKSTSDSLRADSDSSPVEVSSAH
ncbi:AI-2E family transporter [Phormidium sp. CCY1219]|uniref:AI-2E family transporter n=1 Tax=Phormidium sp. CCY1219 TaxID=2886104 RepID=UPI002D1E6BBA|nr:AI-2E family transporter [Phormidium sp. CCY1219]MEB3831398.1 AI-2E family transporter [Phormidium sp. CCY1219]